MGGSGTVVGYRDDGTPILVSNPRDLGDFITDAINTAPPTLGFNVEGRPEFIDIKVTDILNDAVNDPGLIDKIFSSLRDAAISGVNFVGNIVGDILGGVVDIGEEIANSGLGVTLEKFATQFFDRQTIENIVKTSGGISEILNQQVQQILLPTNVTANSIKFSETTSLLLDDSQKLIGQIHNGRFELGDFKIAQNGELFLDDGTIIHKFDDGFVLSTDVIEGRVQTIHINAPEGQEIVRIEGRNGAEIVFDETGQVIDGIIDIVNGAFRFVIENGILTEVFSSVAEASTTVNGQVITIKGVEMPNSLPLELSQAEEIQNQTRWLATFMNAGRFNVSMADQTIHPNSENIVYGTNFFNPITDTPFNIAHALQLGDQQTGLIDLAKGKYFIVYDTEHLAVPLPESVRRVFTGLDGSLPDQLPTGRLQFAINGPVALSEHLIFAGQNHIFNRVRAWLKVLLN